MTDHPLSDLSTPRPWAMTPKKITAKGLGFLESQDGQIIATFHNQHDLNIVREAVNNYEALVTALRAINNLVEATLARGDPRRHALGQITDAVREALARVTLP